MIDLSSIKALDPEVYEGLEKELSRQRNNILFLQICLLRLFRRGDYKFLRV